MERVRSAPVVVATDGTERSAGALGYGIEEARHRQVPLRIVHVSPLLVASDAVLGQAPDLVEQMHRHGRELLAEASATARSAADDLEVETVLAVGTPVHEIVAAGDPGSLLVLGRETRRGAERLLTGTTTAAVAGRSRVPVAVVRGDWRPTVHGRVAVGVESEEHADELLGHAFARAAQHGAALTVIHAWEMPVPYSGIIDSRPYVQEWRAAGARLLRSLLVDWRNAYPGVAVETSVVHGQPAHVLVAGSEATDLLVVGRRPRGVGRWLHLGSTARAVLRAASPPVEVVPLGGRR